LIFRCQKLLTGRVPAAGNNDIQPASGKVAECQSSRKSIRVSTAVDRQSAGSRKNGRAPAECRQAGIVADCRHQEE